MSPTFAINPPHSGASQALLRERLGQLEAVLLEARSRVMLSFDRELASIRGWMDSLDHFNPEVGLQAIAPTAPLTSTETFHGLISETSHLTAATNIVPFSTSVFAPTNLTGVIEEQPLDPALESATIEELNAALAAAFEHISEDHSVAAARSA